MDKVTNYIAKASEAFDAGFRSKASKQYALDLLNCAYRADGRIRTHIATHRSEVAA